MGTATLERPPTTDDGPGGETCSEEFGEHECALPAGHDGEQHRCDCGTTWRIY